MRRLWSVVFAIAAPCSPLAAQAAASLSAFGSYGYSPSADPLPATSLGAALALYAGPLGLRASAASHPRFSDSSFASNAFDHLQLDGDVIARMSGAGSLISAISPITPYAFAGIGRYSDDSVGVVKTWSYGGGLVLALGNRVALEGEVRNRRPFVTSVPQRTEYRVGLALTFGGSSPMPSRSYPASRMPLSFPVGNPTNSSAAAAVMPTAEQYLGVPYKWGGTSPSTGFDCSGYVQYVFAKHGVSLPRTAADMAQSGSAMPVDFNRLAPGDLVMFSESGSRITHVAIVAGNDRIIHSSSSGGGVRFDDLGTARGSWFRKHAVAARRISLGSRAWASELVRQLETQRTAPVGDAPDAAPRP